MTKATHKRKDLIGGYLTDSDGESMSNHHGRKHGSWQAGRQAGKHGTRAVAETLHPDWQAEGV